jgi:hypothetical protein
MSPHGKPRPSLNHCHISQPPPISQSPASKNKKMELVTAPIDILTSSFASETVNVAQTVCSGRIIRSLICAILATKSSIAVR